MARARTNTALTALLRALGIDKHPWVKAATVVAGLLGGGWWLWDSQTPPAQTTATLPKGSEVSCTVKSVYDGDTVSLACPQYGTVKVRVWGIDAPEMDQSPWGERARDNLRRMAQGSVQVQVMDVDRYGRTVARLYVQGKDLGLEQVQKGYTNLYSQYNKDGAYYQARQRAQQQKLGIWAKSGLHQTPWEWRKQHRS